MPTEIHVIPDIWKIIEVIATILAAGGALWFGWSQDQINRRMRALADYVGLSIAPIPNSPALQVTNVGRINLYLHKWEVGSHTETYPEPTLIAAESRTNLVIALNPPPNPGRHKAKFYLTDEIGEKYIGYGEVIITPLSVTPPSQIQLPPDQTGVQRTATSVSITVNMSAVSYRMIKRDWEI